MGIVKPQSNQKLQSRLQSLTKGGLIAPKKMDLKTYLSENWINVKVISEKLFAD